jgi:hypothetical protein
VNFSNCSGATLSAQAPGFEETIKKQTENKVATVGIGIEMTSYLFGGDADTDIVDKTFSPCNPNVL